VSGLSFVFATLIGVFITPDGIVVGADTSVSNRSGQESTRQKYCVIGPRAVATLQGVYELTDTETQATAALYDGFRDLCAQANRSRLPRTLRAQARYMAEGLRESLVTFLQGVPANDVVRKYASNSVVARVAVSGYDNDGPGSVVVGLGVAVDTKSGRWEAQVPGLARYTFDACGARFHGQDVVLTALSNEKDVRIPRGERQTADATKLASVMRGNCAGASIRSAPDLFKAAARLTMTLGTGFGIPKGSVNVPLDVVVIPSAGDIVITRIDSW
jgi:hypothetical protein